MYANNTVPQMLICSIALEEILKHNSRCNVVLQKINERYVFKLTRTLPGEYRAKNWDWYGLCNKSRTQVHYLITLCPTQLYLGPLRAIPACAFCGAFTENIYDDENDTRDDDLHSRNKTRQSSRRRAVSNYILQRTISCREFFACNSKYLTPIYVTCISGNIVVLFRVSHDVNDGPNGTATLISPQNISFAADWWMRNVASVSKSNRNSKEAANIFNQYVSLTRAASNDGFIAADVTPFNMLILTSTGKPPRLVWPACLYWYFRKDRYIVQPHILNTLDSCSFTLFVFRKLSLPTQKSPTYQRKRNNRIDQINRKPTTPIGDQSTDTPFSLAANYKPFSSTQVTGRRSRTGSAKKKFVVERNFANNLLAKDFEDVRYRSHAILENDESCIDSMLLLHRCQYATKLLAFLSQKSVAVNYVAQFATCLAAFLVGGFSELARKPTSIALSDRTREYCVNDTPCNLRHVFSAIGPSSTLFEPLHRFVCVTAANATQIILESESSDAIYQCISDLLKCRDTCEILSAINDTLGER